MTGPGSEMAAGTAGRGGMRASGAEREQAIEVLKAAFVQDRQTKDEFEMRAGQALTARTSAELAMLTADIPVDPAAARPLRKPARMNARPLANRVGVTGVCLTVIAAAVLGILLLTKPDNMGAFLAGLLAAATVVVAPSVTMTVLMIQSRHRQQPAKTARNDLDGPHLVLLVLFIAVLIVMVLMGFK
jgi:L-asparagine transporter-like permease